MPGLLLIPALLHELLDLGAEHVARIWIALFLDELLEHEVRRSGAWAEERRLLSETRIFINDRGFVFPSMMAGNMNRHTKPSAS